MQPVRAREDAVVVDAIMLVVGLSADSPNIRILTHVGPASLLDVFANVLVVHRLQELLDQQNLILNYLETVDPGTYCILLEFLGRGRCIPISPAGLR